VARPVREHPPVIGRAADDHTGSILASRSEGTTPLGGPGADPRPGHHDGPWVNNDGQQRTRDGSTRSGLERWNGVNHPRSRDDHQRRHVRRVHPPLARAGLTTASFSSVEAPGDIAGDSADAESLRLVEPGAEPRKGGAAAVRPTTVGAGPISPRRGPARLPTTCQGLSPEAPKRRACVSTTSLTTAKTG
jgi:hypothetical protein